MIKNKIKQITLPIMFLTFFQSTCFIINVYAENLLAKPINTNIEQNINYIDNLQSDQILENLNISLNTVTDINQIEEISVNKENILSKHIMEKINKKRKDVELEVKKYEEEKQKKEEEKKRKKEEEEKRKREEKKKKKEKIQKEKRKKQKKQNTISRGNASRSKSKQVYSILNAQLGKPYVWGAEGPNSFDCSGLVQYVYRKVGINLPRTAATQATIGTPIKKSQLSCGDLIFFSKDSSKITHVGVYIGNGKMIHAPRTGDVVKVVSINSNYYRNHYAKSVRVLR